MPSEPRTSTDASEDGDAIHRLWPDMGPDDAAAWATLPPERQRRALVRLTALRAIEEDGRRNLNMADAAEEARMGVSTFYAMRERWRASRSLKSLGVYAGRRSDDLLSPKMLATDRRETVSRARAVIEGVLGRDASAGPARINYELGRRGIPLSSTTMKRLLEQVRRGMPVAAVIGRRLTFDNAGADLVDAAGRRQRLCAALDAEAGLILGWALCCEGAIATGYQAAAADALGDLFGDVALDEGLSSIWTSDVPFHGGAPSVDMLVAKGLDATGPDWRRLAHQGSVRAAGRVGLELVKAVGERVGPVWIGTGTRADGRSYRTGRLTSLPVASSVLSGEIDAAVRAHAARRLHLVVRHPAFGREDVHRREISRLEMERVLSAIAGRDQTLGRSVLPEERR